MAAVSSRVQGQRADSRSRSRRPPRTSHPAVENSRRIAGAQSDLAEGPIGKLAGQRVYVRCSLANLAGSWRLAMP
jgi:hypothetical protein